MKGLSGPKLKKALDALYAMIPKSECAQGCDKCCGPIWMSKFEYDRIIERVGPFKVEGIMCPFVKDNTCSIHDIRPLVCRIYGVSEVPQFQCLDNSKPERILTANESAEILKQYLKLCGGARNCQVIGDIAEIKRQLKR